MNCSRCLFRFLIVPALALGLPLPALSQVVLDLGDFPMSVGTVLASESANGIVSVSPGDAGADRTWDFSAISTEFDSYGYYVDPATAPGGDQYPDANVCQQVPMAGGWLCFFHRLDDVGVYLLGAAYGSDPPGTVMVMQIDTTGPILVNPITYGSQWSVTSTWYDMEGEINDVKVATYHADAWGTVTDAYGVFECLRIQKHQIVTYYDEGVPGDTSESWTYEWMAPTQGLVCSANSPNDLPAPDFTEGEFKRVDAGVAATNASSWSAIKAMY